jgi:8-oxo-dGTP pyrophosphatase MutT (NUDIX family)
MKDSLALLLERHVTADADEADHLRRMMRHLRSHTGPFSRNSFDPGHFTASAWVLHPRREAILLIHHDKLDRWLQPGGHLEAADADPVAAARREVLEETGIPAAGLDPATGDLFDLDIHTIPSRGPEPQHLHFDLRFLFRAFDARLEPGAEVRAARWVDLGTWPGENGSAADRRVVAKLAPDRRRPGRVR